MIESIPYNYIYTKAFDIIFKSDTYLNELHNEFTIKERLLAQTFMRNNFELQEPKQSWNELAHELENKSGIDFNRAFKIIRLFFSVQRTLTEIYKYEYLSHVDQCIILTPFQLGLPTECIKSSRKVIEVSSAVVGTNLPPHNLDCFCTVHAYYGDRTNSGVIQVNDPIDNSTFSVPVKTSYDDWIKKLEDRHGVETVKLQKHLSEQKIMPYDHDSFISFYKSLDKETQNNFNLYTPFQLRYIVSECLNDDILTCIDALKIAITKHSYDNFKADLLVQISEKYLKIGEKPIALLNLEKAIYLNPKLHIKRKINNLRKECD